MGDATEDATWLFMQPPLGNTFPILCHSNNNHCHSRRVNFSIVALFFPFLWKVEDLVEITAHLVSSSLNRDLRNSKLQIPEKLGVVLFAGLCCDYSEVSPVASSCDKVLQPSESQPEVTGICNAMTQIPVTPYLGKPSVPTSLHLPMHIMEHSMRQVYKNSLNGKLTVQRFITVIQRHKDYRRKERES